MFLNFKFKVTEYLSLKLRRSKWLARLIEDGSISLSPGAVVGNRVYSWRRQGRIDTGLKLLFNGQSSVFITLSHRYIKTESGCIASWNYYKKELPKFLRRLRLLGADAYIAVKEAHEDGGCHAHIVARWREELYFYQDLMDKKKRWRLGDEVLRAAIKAAWPGGWVDVQGVGSVVAGAYLTKELGKQSHIENALKRAKKNWWAIKEWKRFDEKTRKKLKADDKKRLYAAYFAAITNTRRGIFSKNIPANVEGVEDFRLDSVMNKSTVAVVEVPFALTLKPFFEPYSGAVDPDSELFRVLHKLFHRQAAKHTAA